MRGRSLANCRQHYPALLIGDRFDTHLKVIVARLLHEVAHRHVLDHALAQRADADQPIRSASNGRAPLAGGEQSPPSLIQMRQYSSVAVADTGDIDHAGELHRRPVTAEPPNLTRERKPIQLFPDRP